jgi:hypothetical protein
MPSIFVRVQTKSLRVQCNLCPVCRRVTKGRRDTAEPGAYLEAPCSPWIFSFISSLHKAVSRHEHGASIPHALHGVIPEPEQQKYGRAGLNTPQLIRGTKPELVR